MIRQKPVTTKHKQMKKNILLLLTVLISLSGSFSAQSSAQKDIILLGSTTVSATGIDKPVLPSWNIPAGTNRVMIITFWFERPHINSVTDTSRGDNYPDTGGSAGSVSFNPKVGGIPMSLLSAVRRSIWRKDLVTATAANSDLGTMSYRYTLSDNPVNGLPTGPTAFDFSGIVNANATNADEVIVSVEVYGNVSPTALFAEASNNLFINNSQGNPQANTTTFTSTAPTPVTTPVGRIAADVMYQGFMGTTKDEAPLTVSAGWTLVTNTKVTNNVGYNFKTGVPNELVNEADGINLATFYRFGSAAITVTRPTSDAINCARINTIALLPLAKPSISGTVFSDTDGPTNINGTGTSGGGLYVNLVDSLGNLIYSAPVAADGKYAIPVGYAVETFKYTLQLSKNTGTLGSTAPAKALNLGWSIVGEAIASTGNDGTADSSISFTAGTANVTGYNYGIVLTPVDSFCYKSGATGTATLDSKVGISALSRAGEDDADNWPMTRKGAWLVLEAKTKGFAPNKVKFNASNLPVAEDGITLLITTPVEGMMVYDVTNHCLKIYTSKDGFAFAWHCMSTQTCPD